MSHTWGKSPKDKTISFKNKLTGRVYTQPIYEHLKGSLSKQERLDNTFDEFKLKAYSLYDNQYVYEDFVSYNEPITVINTQTGKKYKQRIQHILSGKLPSDESKRKYTKENCQEFSDIAHNNRFSIDTTTFENANSLVSLTDNQTGKKYTQLYCDHIKGSLPKEISYSSISKQEKKLIELINKLYPNLKVVTSYRPKWLNGKEIDIYLPELNLGIEYNGIIYHHSEINPKNSFLNKTYKDENFHLCKSQICLDNELKLIHVFEHEVVDIKQLIEQYTKYEIQLFGNIKEYVNVKTLKITNSMDENSVLICKPNVKFI